MPKKSFSFQMKRVQTSGLIIDLWVISDNLLLSKICRQKCFIFFEQNYEIWAKMLNYKKSKILTSYVQGLSSSISGHLESTLSNLCLKLCPLWNKLMSILTPKSIISNVALTFLNMSELVWASVLNSGCLVTCNNKKHVIRYEITWLSKKIYQLVECNASSKI